MYSVERVNSQLSHVHFVQNHEISVPPEFRAKHGLATSDDNDDDFSSSSQSLTATSELPKLLKVIPVRHLLSFSDLLI